MTGWLARRLLAVLLRRASNEALREAFRRAERAPPTPEPAPFVCPKGLECPYLCHDCRIAGKAKP